jgi:aminopeptidase N
MRKSPPGCRQHTARSILPVLACWCVMVTSPGTAADTRLAGSSLSPAIDVLHYNIAVTLDMEGGMLSGRVTMTARMNTTADEIVLNAACLTIDQATVNGEIWSTSLDSLQESLILRAPGAGRAAGETVMVAVDYRRLPGPTRPGGRWGYYFFRDTLGLPSNLGYTMAEPSDARFWMPCVDTPTDKASAELFVTVPAGYVAASNGKLLEAAPAPGNTTVWHWRESHPIATYLISITASQFTISSVPFVRAAGDTLPVQYYVWPSDSAECAAYLPTVNAMLAGLSDMFGPYPFDKYGMTAIVPFGYGGMEHQTITTMNRYLKTDERVVVHELAHQWWGDLVTCGTWKDVWLNESFATYAEALWAEQRGGREALRHYMHSALEHFYFGSWQGGPYDPEGQGFNLFDDVVYGKGAWVLHTLRGVIGDSCFFGTLARYRELHAGKTATTEDFRAVVDTVTGRSMGWFFDQWVYGRGWPMYASTFSWASDTLTVRVTQEQSNSWPTFTVPLQVRAKNGVRDTLFSITPDARLCVAKVPLSFGPSSVILDPDSLVLKQIVTAVGVTDNPPQPTEFGLEQNYPNPFNPVTTIGFRVPGIGSRGNGASARDPGAGALSVKLSVYDLLGREVAVLVDEPKPAGTYTVQFNGSGVSSGVYLVRLQAGGGTAVKSMLLIR